jgi:hypothetical protein
MSGVNVAGAKVTFFNTHCERVVVVVGGSVRGSSSGEALKSLWDKMMNKGSKEKLKTLRDQRNQNIWWIP